MELKVSSASNGTSTLLMPNASVAVLPLLVVLEHQVAVGFEGELLLTQPNP
jgi:hypothetical protein